MALNIRYQKVKYRAKQAYFAVRSMIIFGNNGIPPSWTLKLPKPSQKLIQGRGWWLKKMAAAINVPLSFRLKTPAQ